MISALFPLVSLCVVLFFLWLPAVSYPIVSDTAVYALLGESVWKHGVFAVLGDLHGKYLPLHAFLSYPLVHFFGYHVGMKVSTLVAGWGVLLLLFYILRRCFSSVVALSAVTVLAFYHGFVVMTMLGSVDMLFTVLFLSSVLFYLFAEDDDRLYVPMGFFLGLSLLTRYNGVMLFPAILLHAVIARRDHLRSLWFWIGVVLGGVPLSLWFVRNTIVFGSLLRSDYGAEFSSQFSGLFSQLFTNIAYYGHPARNVLPVFLLFGLYGLVRFWRQQLFLVFVMGFQIGFFLLWPILNIRYAVPVYALFLGFALCGLQDALHFLSQPIRRVVLVMILSVLFVTHALALCLYSYGSCNAAFDRAYGSFPQNMGLAMEGFYTWDQARDYINTHASRGSIVSAGGEVNATLMRTGVFRDDLVVSPKDDLSCHHYYITQEPYPHHVILFSTEDIPVTYVVRGLCP